MNKLFCGLLLVPALMGTAGCSAVNQLVGSSVSAGAPTTQDDEDLITYQKYFTSAEVMNCIGKVRATPERRSCRDLVTYARMRYIDINYEKFRRRAFLEVNGGNAATDIAVLGLSAAGALVPAASTKAILAAISGGLVGAKGVIDKDVLYNAGIQTLILKMDADRAAVRLRVTKSLKQNEEVYPFEAAELDTGDYYRVGTLTNALITLQGDAGATLQSDTTLINEIPKAPVPSPPEAVAFSNAARAAAPAPAPTPPAAPAPAAAATSPATPPVVVPAPPPPADAAPAPRSNRTSAVTPQPPTPLVTQCKDSGPIIPPLCPPLTPEAQARRQQVRDSVKRLTDLTKLQAVARVLGVSSPVLTARCIQRDIIAHVEQVCTDAQIQEMNRELADPSLMR